MIRYLEGDATQPVGDGPKLLVHICNDVGGWGKGFVTAISRRWREPEALYRAWYRERADNDFALGAVQFVGVEEDLTVVNLVAQRGLKRRAGGGPAVRYEAIDAGLQAVHDRAVGAGASVHMPRIGCGLAGGRWEEIEPILMRRLAGVDVTVYDFKP